MSGDAEIVVVRLGHRPGRDDRMTTHVGLTARALGADRFVLAARDRGPLDRIDDVTTRFGGPFPTEQVAGFGEWVRGWEGALVHLTMYGRPLQKQLEDVKDAARTRSLAVVVGAEKVPFDVYQAAEWNLAVTNQPHSEVGSLAVFLDRLSVGTGLGCSFEGGTHRIVPQAEGKRVVERSESTGPS